MRIVHVITRLVRAGSERNLAHFLEWQERHGHDVTVLVGPAADESLLPDGVPVEVIEGLGRELNVLEDVKAYRSLQSCLETARPDVVHTHQSKAGILGRLAADPRRQVVVHTVHMASFGPSYGRLSRVLRAAERRCAKRTDFMITVGEQLQAEYLAAGVGVPVQYRVLRSPVGVEKLQGTRTLGRDDRLNLRQKWRIPASSRILLAVGALEKRKRQALLVHELRPLLTSGEAILVLAGAGPELESLTELVRALGVSDQVCLLGQVENIHEVYALADVFVHASETEGVPQVVIQALAAGLPVVATEAQGLREIPDAGVVVTSAGGAGFRRAVERVLQHPPPAPAAAAFLPWSRSTVEEEIARFHVELEASLLRRRSSPVLRDGRSAA